jgi:hypothetical protein
MAGCLAIIKLLGQRLIWIERKLVRRVRLGCRPPLPGCLAAPGAITDYLHSADRLQPASRPSSLANRHLRRPAAIAYRPEAISENRRLSWVEIVFCSWSFWEKVINGFRCRKARSRRSGPRFTNSGVAAVGLAGLGARVGWQLAQWFRFRNGDLAHAIASFNSSRRDSSQIGLPTTVPSGGGNCPRRLSL